MSSSKFAGVILRHGDRVAIESVGGGSYGDPHLREPEPVFADAADGLVTLKRASADYRGAVVRTPAGRLKLEAERTAALRAAASD